MFSKGYEKSLYESDSIGIFWRNLIEDRSWIRRRVETISIINSHHIERKGSIDVSPKHLRKVAISTDLIRSNECNKRIDVPVPLIGQKKKVPFDFDLRDGGGNSIATCSSRETSEFSYQHIISFLQDVGFRAREIPDPLREFFSKVCGCDLNSPINTGNNKDLLEDLKNIKNAEGLDQRSKIILDRITAVEEHYAYLSSLLNIISTTHYVACNIRVDLSAEEVQVVKYRIIEKRENINYDAIKRKDKKAVPPGVDEHELEKNKIFKKGIKNPVRIIAVPMPGVHDSPSVIVRVLAPEGMTFNGMDLVGKNLDKEQVQQRLSDSRLILYMRKNSSNQASGCQLIVGLQPERSGFILPAAVTLSVLGAMIFIIGLISALCKIDSQTAAAAIVLLPSFIAVELVRRKDHQFVAKSLLNAQKWVSCAVIVSLLPLLVFSVSGNILSVDLPKAIDFTSPPEGWIPSFLLYYANLSISGVFKLAFDIILVLCGIFIFIVGMMLCGMSLRIKRINKFSRKKYADYRFPEEALSDARDENV